MTQNEISISFFFAIFYKNRHLHLLRFCIFVFFAVAFVPIKIQTHSVPQNDRRNLSFVIDKHEVGQKMARYGHKIAIYQLLFFGSSPISHAASTYI